MTDHLSERCAVEVTEGRRDVAAGSAEPQMGRLEATAYRVEWRASARFRRSFLEALSARRAAAIADDDCNRGANGSAGPASAKPHGFRTLYRSPAEEDSEFEESGPRRPMRAVPVPPSRIAARLMLARLFDGRPDLQNAIRTGAPVVTIDVPDPESLRHVLSVWPETLLEDSLRVFEIGEHGGLRGDFDVLHIAATEPPKTGGNRTGERQAVAALSLALPVIAISPSAETHLPRAVMKSAPARLFLPPADATAIGRTVRIVTGKRCGETLDPATAAALSPTDLNLAIRVDRTPAECLAELRRLVGESRPRSLVREIDLDDIHGMPEAVAWARSLIRDVEAWSRHELDWSEVNVSILRSSSASATLDCSSAAAASRAFLASATTIWPRSAARRCVTWSSICSRALANCPRS